MFSFNYFVFFTIFFHCLLSFGQNNNKRNIAIGDSIILRFPKTYLTLGEPAKLNIKRIVQNPDYSYSIEFQTLAPDICFLNFKSIIDNSNKAKNTYKLGYSHALNQFPNGDFSFNIYIAKIDQTSSIKLSNSLTSKDTEYYFVIHFSLEIGYSPFQ